MDEPKKTTLYTKILCYNDNIQNNINLWFGFLI